VLAAVPLSPSSVNHPPPRLGIEALWRVPLDWTCWASGPISGLYCYRCSLHFLETSFAKEMYAASDDVLDAWRIATELFDRVCWDREICLSAYATDKLPKPPLAPQHVDLCSQFKPDARSKNPAGYTMDSVTGLDRAVMCTVIGQKATAKALTAAVTRIESDHHLPELAFSCTGGTHRSVAFACLLAMFAYPRAEVRLTTRRTIAAAKGVLVLK
jgi:hypothetical protein